MVKVWDARTKQALLTLEGQAYVRAVAFSPDGSRIASGSGDSTVRVWDARTGQGLLTLKGHTEFVTVVAFSPDGSRIASGGHDKTLKVWDARTGQDLLTLKGHTDHVHAVAFSPDGSRIASGSRDDTVKVWDAPTDKGLRYFKGHSKPLTQVAFTPDGKRVVGRDESGKVLAWDVDVGRLLPSAPEMPPDSGHTAAFGSYRAEAHGNLVRVERILSAEERHRREQEQARVEAILRARRDREFHQAEADRTRVIDPFACAFHLDRLLALSPDDRPALLKRRADVLAAAVKRDPDNHHSARALARQAIADFDTVPDAKALLPLIARHQHAPLDRLHGALLLRTGNARDAALVLRAAIRNRTTPEQPPIDELLLALALVELDRHDEARQLLKKAAEWMDGGTAPQRLASLLALRPAGPLATLAAVAHAPDPRLNALDPFTGHELVTLRAELEESLRGDKR
jgi:hypothetical protein